MENPKPSPFMLSGKRYVAWLLLVPLLVGVLAWLFS